VANTTMVKASQWPKKTDHETQETKKVLYSCQAPLA
jgi:hypothetical protein